MKKGSNNLVFGMWANPFAFGVDGESLTIFASIIVGSWLGARVVFHSDDLVSIVAIALVVTLFMPLVASALVISDWVLVGAVLLLAVAAGQWLFKVGWTSSLALVVLAWLFGSLLLK